MKIRNGMQILFTEKDDFWVNEIRNKIGIVVRVENTCFYVRVPNFKELVVVYNSELEQGLVKVLGSIWRQKIDE